MRSTAPFAAACLFVFAGASASRAASPFGDAFWKHWGDGRAEIAAYDLVYPRYGEARPGTAVTIFVTETFSQEARVKADPGVHDASDEFQVMKLNLVQDFATGIYDYNLMTSTFVALTPRLGRAEGHPAKVSFSAQEWCGHAWTQLLPDEKSIRLTSHSYFDGEADRSETLPYPEDAVLEDVLLCWARGLAAPFLDPGESRSVPVLRSAEVARLRHLPEQWQDGLLSRSAEAREVEVPAGVFEVETLTVQLPDGRAWEFLVERAAPRRLVRWSVSDGRKASLVASERLVYWRMNANRFEEALAQLGLSPRPPRTP